MLKLTTDRQEALRGICATVELVFIPNLHSSPPLMGSRRNIAIMTCLLRKKTRMAWLPDG